MTIGDSVTGLFRSQPSYGMPRGKIGSFSLFDGWTSRGGGLSTLGNRELTLQLAGVGMLRSTVFLPDGACAHEYRKEAGKHGINVVETERLLSYDYPHLWLSFLPPDPKPNVIISHG